VPYSSFEAFVHQHHVSLYRTALLLSGDPHAADDLVQTALIRVYSRWPQLRDQEPAAYARRVVVNAHHDVWRRTGRRESPVADPPQPESTSVPGTSGRVVDRDALLQALRSLTPRERRVVVLRFIYDLPEADTARELGMRVGTVKSTTNRAIGKLRSDASLAAAFTQEPT